MLYLLNFLLKFNKKFSKLFFDKMIILEYNTCILGDGFMSKISIVVPCFNSASYLCECLDSLVNQTHKDLEMILVDDCSSDNTSEIMNEYAKRDKRIKVLRNKENKGAGFSRNRGLDIAKGEYITFVDSDDFLDLDVYEKVNEIIEKNNCPDIIRFDISKFFNIGNLKINLEFLIKTKFNGEYSIVNPKHNHRYVAFEGPSACNKAFKRSFVGETRFIEGKKWEDYPFTTFLLGKAKEIVFINAKYNYRFPIFSCSNTTMSDSKKISSKIVDIFDCCDLVENQYKEAGLFNEFKDVIRSNQKIHALQRAKEVMTTEGYSYKEKKMIINAIINLIEVKYGEVFETEFYKEFYKKRLLAKAKSCFLESCVQLYVTIYRFFY